MIVLWILLIVLAVIVIGAFVLASGLLDGRVNQCFDDVMREADKRNKKAKKVRRIR